MTSHRLEKVESLLMHEISECLTRRVDDPRVKGVHLVSVSVSPDLHLARVNYSTLTEERPIEEVQQGLDSAKALIRQVVKKKVLLRIMPELAFFFDPSIRHGDKILALLRKLDPPKD